MPNGQILRAAPQNGDPGTGILAAASTDGVATIQILALDASTAADPGYWMPWAPFHKGSFEVTGTFDASVTLKTSNAAQQPYNIIQLTVGGTAHTGDVLSLTIMCDNFYGGRISTSYTVLNTDTLTTITAALLAAINAALALAAQQIINDSQSTSLAASIMGAVTGGSDLINVQWAYPLAPLQIITSVTGTGHTTTLAAAPYDDGSGFAVANCTVTEAGNVPFDLCGTWIKATVSSYVSGPVTAIVQGNIP